MDTIFFFCSSNINKGKYDYPIGEIEWKYQKQLFQVQKGVYQFVKISFTKKQQNRFNGQFYHEYYLFLSLFAIIEFYDLIHTFLDLKQLFLIFPLNFPKGVIIFIFLILEEQNNNKSYPRNQVTRLTNIWLYSDLYGL